MPRFGEAHKLLSPTHPDTEPPAAGADPADGQVPTWSAALKAFTAQDPTGDGVSDHGLLDGLGDDDHPHYALADKSRPDPWVAAADLSPRSLADLGAKAHDLLAGLGDDDHSIYALLSGRSGGQSLIGGLAASEHLTLQATAHATRGYVRAQDDLQLLSNILRDSGGTNRLELKTTSPHLTLTGQTKITGESAIGGVAPAANKLLQIQPGTPPVTGILRALMGTVVANVPSGRAGGLIRALEFTVGAGGGGVGTVMPEVSCVKVIPSAMGYTGAITDTWGVQMGNIMAMGGAPVFTRVTGFEFPTLTPASIVDVYGFRARDTVANSGFVRLLELGPATPYLRVVGGAAPGAGLSNLYLNVGGTLYRVRTRTINGYEALTIN